MKKIGIIGRGFVGSAVEFGFSAQTGCNAEVKIYDKDPKLSLHSLEETVNSSQFIFVSVPTPSNSDGSINLSVTGGTPPYTYSWSNGAITQNISSLTSGNYTVQVTDAAGQSANSTFFIYRSWLVRTKKFQRICQRICHKSSKRFELFSSKVQTC